MSRKDDDGYEPSTDGNFLGDLCTDKLSTYGKGTYTTELASVGLNKS